MQILASLYGIRAPLEGQWRFKLGEYVVVRGPGVGKDLAWARIWRGQATPLHFASHVRCGWCVEPAWARIWRGQDLAWASHATTFCTQEESCECCPSTE